MIIRILCKIIGHRFVKIVGPNAEHVNYFYFKCGRCHAIDWERPDCGN
jgi:hypothetical protein